MKGVEPRVVVGAEDGAASDAQPRLTARRIIIIEVEDCSMARSNTQGGSGGSDVQVLYEQTVRKRVCEVAHRCWRVKKLATPAPTCTSGPSGPTGRPEATEQMVPSTFTTT